MKMQNPLQIESTFAPEVASGWFSAGWKPSILDYVKVGTYYAGKHSELRFIV